MAALAVAALLPACTSGSDDDARSAPPDDTTVASSPGADRPDGPAADLSEELTGGAGPFVGAAEPPDLGDDFVQEERVASGTATSYRPAGELTPDGRWTFEEDQTADYRTRVLVRRPARTEDFSGTVLVEWLNVSGGIDAEPGFTTLREEILRRGHAWIGLSAQLIGVEGGPVVVPVEVPGAEQAGQGLRAIDPERYGSLHHPGDGFSFDVLTQVARALRTGGPVLGGTAPTNLIAVGESQSAFALVTYVNGVQPLTGAFDGFLVHSRGGSSLSLAEPGEAADIASSLGGVTTILRDDTEAPILELQTESDLLGILGSAQARQPDTDRFRLWEVAGTAHADRHLVGASIADTLDCGVPINDGPTHIVGKAALRHLVAWVEGGEPPPEAPRIELTEGDPQEIRRDPDGIALGGVRTPPVDVPVRVLSGEPGPDDSVICMLMGSTTPLPPERIDELHGTRAAYLAAYGTALDAAVDAGFVLADDRSALEADSHPELVPE